MPSLVAPSLSFPAGFQQALPAPPLRGAFTAPCTGAGVEKQNQKPTKNLLAGLDLGVDSCLCPPPPRLSFSPAASPWRHYFIPIPSPFPSLIPPTPAAPFGAALCKTAE